MANEQPNLTTAELADRWRMSPETLRNWRFRGFGPKHFKPSGKERGKTLYKLTDVIAWEQKNMMGGAA